MADQHPADVFHLWSPPEGWASDDLALVWTGGSAEVNNLADVTVAGAGACLPALALALCGFYLEE